MIHAPSQLRNIALGFTRGSYRRGSRAAVASLVVGLVVVLGGNSRVTAADFFWNNAAGGTYGTASSWTPAGPPDTGDTATIDLAGTYTVILDDDRTINTFNLNNATATLSHTNGTYFVENAINLQAGTYHLDGGWINGVVAGAKITSSGGKLLVGSSSWNAIINMDIDAGVLDFSGINGRLVLSGTTTFGDASLTLINGNQLGFEKTTTLTNKTFNLGDATTYGYLTVEGDNTLTFGSSTTINVQGNGYLYSGAYLGDWGNREPGPDRKDC